MPLYYLTLVIALITVDRWLLTTPVWLQHFIAHLLFIHPFDANSFSSINGPNWSVGIEIQFYLLAAVSLRILLRPRWRWWILAVAALLAVAWRYAAFLPDGSSTSYQMFVRSAQLPGRLDEFAIGITLAIFVRSPGFTVAQKQRRSISAAAIALGLVGVYYCLTWKWDTGDTAINAAIIRLMISIAFGSILLGTVLVSSHAIIRLSAPFRYLGTISYGLYLWHLIVLMNMKDSGLQPSLILTITFSATILISAASWHFFELPAMQAARRMSASPGNKNATFT